MSLNLVDSLKELFPAGADLHTPSLGKLEKELLLDCIDSTFVSSVGPKIVEVERRLSDITGSSFAAATCNGTSALHLCLHVCGVTRGSLAIVPAMTFAATANAVLYTGAKCLIVDIESERLGIDPVKLKDFLKSEATIEGGRCVYRKSGEPISALVLVHLFGIPALSEEIADICRENRIEFIEDAAESLGSYQGGKHTGTFAKLAALSFNGNKIVTAGGGGAVLTSDKALHGEIKHISTTAKKSKDFTFFHDKMGFNYRMPNLNAALLLAQLERLPEFLQSKDKLHLRYREMFSRLEDGYLQECPSDSKSNYWLNNYILKREKSSQHRSYFQNLNDAGIRVRPAWDLMHTLPYLEAMPRMEDLGVAEDIGARLISLPSSSHLQI